MNIQEDTVFPIYEPLYAVYPETLKNFGSDFPWMHYSLEILASVTLFICKPGLQTFALPFHGPAWPNEANFVVHSHVVYCSSSCLTSAIVCNAFQR